MTYFCPFALVVLIIEFPAVRHLAALPRLVVVPVDSTCADFRCLLEFIGKPFRAVVLWPPVSVRDASVVAVSRNETVVDGRERRESAL